MSKVSRTTEPFEKTIERYNSKKWLQELQINLRKVQTRIIKQKLHDPLIPKVISQVSLEKAHLLIQHKSQIFKLLQHEPQVRVIKYLDINKETLFLVMFYLTEEKTT